MLGRYQIEKSSARARWLSSTAARTEDRPRRRHQDHALSRSFEAESSPRPRSDSFAKPKPAGRLNHPNIVTIFDAGEEHDLCYIAMEFLKGKDLVPYTKQPNLLPPDKVLSIVERVADALGYAHTMGVVHRDIKPANIMYEPDADVAKVTDFGIARITDSSKTKTGMVLGTPSYMSPEQLAGKRIDGRSDLFSLGVTLFQMLAGRLPFEGESMTQLMFAIANNRIRRSGSIRRCGMGRPDHRQGARRTWRGATDGAEFAEPCARRAGRRHGAYGPCRLERGRARGSAHPSIEIAGSARRRPLRHRGHLLDTKPYDFKLAAGFAPPASRSTRCGSDHGGSQPHHRRCRARWMLCPTWATATTRPRVSQAHRLGDPPGYHQRVKELFAACAAART